MKATAHFGPKLSKSKGNAETEAKKEKRAKFVKDCTARRSDGVFSIGNRVLEFLRDNQQGKLDKNADYQILLNSSGQSIESNTNSLLDSLRRLPTLDTKMLANEQLRLSLNHPRKGLKTNAASLYDIVTKNDVIDLTNNEDIVKLSLSIPARDNFRDVLKDYNKARGNVDEEEQEKEEAADAPTKRVRKQTERSAQQLFPFQNQILEIRSVILAKLKRWKLNLIQIKINAQEGKQDQKWMPEQQQQQL